MSYNVSRLFYAEACGKFGNTISDAWLEFDRMPFMKTLLLLKTELLFPLDPSKLPILKCYELFRLVFLRDFLLFTPKLNAFF